MSELVSKIILGSVAAVGLAVVLIVFGMIASDSSAGPRVQFTFAALFVFMCFLGLLAFRVLTHSTAKFVETLSRASIYSDEFIDTAFRYYSRSATTFRMAAAFLLLMFLGQVAVLIVEYQTASTLSWILSLVFGLPLVLLLNYLRSGWSLLRALKESRKLGSHQQHQSLVAIASSRPEDPVSSVLLARLASEVGYRDDI